MPYSFVHQILVHLPEDHALGRLLPQGRGEVPDRVERADEIDVEHSEADKEQQGDLKNKRSAVKCGSRGYWLFTYPEEEELGVLAQTLLRLCASLTQVILLLFGDVVLAANLK